MNSQIQIAEFRWIVRFRAVITMVSVLIGLTAYGQAPGGALDLELLVSRAEMAASSQRWEMAGRYYEEALAVASGPRQAMIEQKLQLCRAHVAVDKRYGDGTVARDIETAPFAQGCDLVKSVWSMIRDNYHEPVREEALLRKALFQMALVLEKQPVRDQYGMDAVNGEALRRALGAIQAELNDDPNRFGFDGLYYRVSGLSQLSEQAGLGQAWPMIELAYALAGSLDRYCYLLSPAQYDHLYGQLTGVYSGIGVDLIFDGDYPFVYDVAPGSSAATQGIRPGDTIHKVNGVDIRRQSAEAVRTLLAGPENTGLLLTVSRPAQAAEAASMITLAVERTLIEAPTVRNSRVFPDGTGYFRVASFDFDTAWQMREAIERLKGQRIGRLVIDLRNNGGGVLDAAVNAVRLFIDEGVIVTVQSNRERVKYRAGGDNFRCFDLPVILLVNGNTASAAELFAASLRDHGRALIVGEQTYGKAVVQSIYKVQPVKYGLCLTTAAYLPPGGENFNLKGLAPNRRAKNGDNNPEKLISALDMISPADPVLRVALQQSDDAS